MIIDTVRIIHTGKGLFPTFKVSILTINTPDLIDIKELSNFHLRYPGY